MDSERTFDRLSRALKGCTEGEVRRLAEKKGFSEVETEALIFARAALNVEDEKSAHRLYDAWLRLELIERATTAREVLFVEYAEICVECAF